VDSTRCDFIKVTATQECMLPVPHIDLSASIGVHQVHDWQQHINVHLRVAGIINTIRHNDDDDDDDDDDDGELARFVTTAQL
jgi:hypothetical protein